MASTVSLTGPLFDHEPAPAVRDAIQKGILQAALLGQRLVQEQLTPGHGVKTGAFRRSVAGTSSAWHTGIVESPLLYSGWLESGERRGRQTRFEGYHMFENAAKKLDDADLSAKIGAAVAAALGGDGHG